MDDDLLALPNRDPHDLLAGTIWGRRWRRLTPKDIEEAERVLDLLTNLIGEISSEVVQDILEDFCAELANLGERAEEAA